MTEADERSSESVPDNPIYHTKHIFRIAFLLIFVVTSLVLSRSLFGNQDDCTAVGITSDIAHGFESQYQLAWVDDRFKLVFVPQNLDADAKQAARHNQNPATDFEFEWYDIVNDPEESTNIAAGNPEIVRQMSQQLSGWRSSVARSIEGVER